VKSSKDIHVDLDKRSDRGQMSMELIIINMLLIKIDEFLN